MQQIGRGRIYFIIYLTKYINLVLCVFLFFILVFLTWLLIGDGLGDDWRFVFRPATMELIQGKNPYDITHFMIAPWVLLLFLPLSLLSEDLGMAVLIVTGLCVYAYIAIKLKAKPLGVIAILLSPMVFHNLINGNIDWLALLGFVLPPQIGIFFLVLKPQIGITLMLYWAYIAFSEKHFSKTFAPFIIVTIASFFVFGFWPIKMLTVQAEYNTSAWPISIPFGLAMMVMAINKKKERIAEAISPLFSPHVMFHSWVTVLYALAPDTFKLIILSLSAWLLVGITAFI